MARFNYKIQHLASEFWSSAGIEPTYPINNCLLEQAVVLSFPLSIIKINKLDFQGIINWLKENGLNPVSHNFENNFSLFGLLFVCKGKGFIFIDGCANSKEQLFTLAHEVSHYVLDYEQKKMQLTKTLGKEASDIFHGLRNPSASEQLKSIISGVEAKPYLHMIENCDTDSWQRIDIWKIENNADSFAMELLAPFKSIIRELHALKVISKYDSIMENLPVILEDKYGFPTYLANKYAKLVAYSITSGSNVLDRLKY